MLDLDLSLATLVLDHPGVAPVLQRHRLDFCCRGHMTLAAACSERGLAHEAIAEELAAAVEARALAQDAARSPAADPRARSTEALIHHIVHTHHSYLREVLPFLQATSAKVARVHGDHNPRLRALDSAVQGLVAALPPHLVAEEAVLFPALLAETPDRGVIAAELASMHADHLAVGALLQAVRAESEDFHLPEWACNSYRALFGELAALETDILRHVHLENHVIMPRFA